MDFKFFNFISENWLQAIGATLFHSLWIGVVLSLLTALMILMTRKSSAALRYQLLTTGLCLFVVAIGLTLYLEFDNAPLVSAKQLATMDAQNAGAAMLQPMVQQSISKTPIDISSKIGQLLSLWNSYATQIVLIWFLIICAKGVHLLLGLNTIFYIKRNKIYEAGKLWEDKLISLANQMGVTQKVKLFQSGIAQIPLVAGHFKPVILIPLGLLNGLSMVEVEAILSHELAHIKRRDYLVNLLQSFIEIVFFFNPAVLWVSKLIRTERENCCDDLALTCVPDKKSYVKALLSCQEFQLNTPAYAMALVGKKSALLNRVSRMLFNTKSTLNKMEKTILTLAMVFIFLGSAAFSNAESKQVVPNLKKETLAQDTTKKKLKKPVAIKTTNRAPKANEISAKLSSKEQAEFDAAQAGYAAAQKEYTTNQQRYEADHKRYTETERNRVSQKEYDRNVQLYEQSQQRYKEAQEHYNREARRYTRDSIQFERMRRAVYPEKPTSPAPYRPSMTSPVPLQPVAPVQNLKSSPLSVSAAPEVNLNLNLATPVTPAPPQTPSTTIKSSKKTVSITDGGGVNGDELSDKVNNEMLKDGLITQTEKLSYRLDKDALYVNGKKQSAEMHKKYKAKYLKSSTSALLYNYEINSEK